MKKLFILSFVCIIAFNNANAQEGDFLIGATSDVNNKSIIWWSLNPTVGYFVSDNLCIGLGLGMQSSSQDLADGDILQESDSFAIMPFVRLYQDDLFFYAGIGIGSASSLYDEDLDGSDYRAKTKSSSFGFLAGIGYSLMWGKHLTFEPAVGISTSRGGGESEVNYAGIESDDDYDLPSTFDFGISLGISLRFGDEE